MNVQMKKCPVCAEEIKAEALICRFCKARFDVRIRGYCPQDHQLVDADKNGKCLMCGGELTDLHVESELIKEAIQAPPHASSPVARSVPNKPGAKKVWAIIGTVMISLLCGFPGVLIFSLGAISFVGLLSPGVPPDMLAETLSQSGLTKQEFILSLLGFIGVGIFLILIPIVFGILTLRNKKPADDRPRKSIGFTLVPIAGICVALVGVTVLTAKTAMPRLNAFLATETLISPTLTPMPSATAIQTSSLHYGGLYLSVSFNPVWGESGSYLRFYEDGTVLQVSSTGKPEEVAVWFNKTHPYSSKGQYKVDGTMLEFTVTSEEGTVDYAGIINGDELTLEMYSHINGYKHTEVYTFIKIPGMQQ